MTNDVVPGQSKEADPYKTLFSEEGRLLLAMVLHEFASGAGTALELEVALEEYTAAKHCARNHAIKRLLKAGWLEGSGEGDEVRFNLTEKAYALMVKHGLRERKNAETIKILQ